MFATKHLPERPDALAPDGSEVKALLELSGGGLAHFGLAAGQTSVAVRHRTVEEIWYIVSGYGKMWRRLDGYEEIVDLRPGHCLTIPLGTDFQFKSTRPDGLGVIAITMPPWPGAGEAIRSQGPWRPTVTPGYGLDEPEAPE